MSNLKHLQKRITESAKDPTFIYVPKGKTINPENFNVISQQLRILDEFWKTPWDLAQELFVDRLIEEKLIDPYKDNSESFSAVARMQIPVWKLLGFAWVNKENIPEVTPVGRAFFKASLKKQKEIVKVQTLRYQDGNPSLDRKFHSNRGFPVNEILKLLVLADWKLSREEFIYFGSKVSSHNDIYQTFYDLSLWRELTKEDKDFLSKVAENAVSDKGRNIFATIENVYSYIIWFLTASELISRDESGICVMPKNQKKVIDLLTRYRSAVQIDYASEGDWLAQYGTIIPKSRKNEPWSIIEDAQDYYENIGSVDKATDAYAKSKNVSVNELQDYRSMIVQEQVIEDILEYNVNSLRSDLSLVRRQYSTGVGPIDLLCRDKDLNFVVVELKKGRASDKVLGQVLRYMGWVKDRLAVKEDVKVFGIIVGKDFDSKNTAALSATEGITTFCYDVKASFSSFDQTLH
ncbi:endonuclease NucS domain-containing protein [Robiginitomaculum antarcticum]|uniref:endonuclease NucS domain-containing protein n=1 Tax=Robiginitomaculum antarcticum TaxID=437507 RepID=UPI00037FBDB7|nr:endonuclease NucS domain-containing protein [Robiginitomaculum antarcticum]